MKSSLTLQFFLSFGQNLGLYYCKIQKQPSRGVLTKRCSKNTQQTCRKTRICRSVISRKLLCNIILWHVCSPVNLLHIFRTSFCKNTSGDCFWRKNVKQCYRFFKSPHTQKKFLKRQLLSRWNKQNWANLKKLKTWILCNFKGTLM